MKVESEIALKCLRGCIGIENLYITHEIIFYKIFKNTYGIGHALFKCNNAFLTEINNERQMELTLSE